MNSSSLPPPIRANALSLQTLLQDANIRGTLMISATDVEYRETCTPRRRHETRIHARLPSFLFDLRRVVMNRNFLAIPDGDTWEEQVAGVCNEINQFNNNSRNDERLLQYYLLGLLMFQRGFSNAAKNRAKNFLLPSSQPGFWQISRRTYLLYSTRGTWNIPNTINLSCYALQYMSETDFHEVLMREAAAARTSEDINFPSNF